MLKVENIQVFNFEGAMRGLRNPKDSWNRSDSIYGILDLTEGYVNEDLTEVASTYVNLDYDDENYDKEIERITDWLLNNDIYLEEDGRLESYAYIGAKDLNLAQRMIGAGTDESKFLRQIFISMDITAPLYWWKEFDTYKVGTVSNSCSTMHKLADNPITLDCFSFDNDDFIDEWPDDLSISELTKRDIEELEWLRQRYKETGNKVYWRLLIQKLPSSWNQKRTITLNYQVARTMYFARRYHKLIEWHTLCQAFESLPYGKEMICYEKPKKMDAITLGILKTLGIPTKVNGVTRTTEEVLADVAKIAQAINILKGTGGE